MMAETAADRRGCAPFLKWPGGKRWAAARITEIIRPALGRDGVYFEPFLGGGAVFFHLQPKSAVLSDINTDLIATYSAICSDYVSVVQRLKELPVSHEMYYRIREQMWDSPVDSAASILYLNRTAFGGIYRLNKKGRFNVPYGGGSRTPELLYDGSILGTAAVALSRADLRVSDFEPVVDEARSGDVVYCDPTYTVAHNNNGFVRYNESNFSWADQERLAAAVRRARARGVTVLVSNAHHPSILALYTGARVEVLSRVSRVSPDPQKRRAVSEYLFVLAP